MCDFIVNPRKPTIVLAMRPGSNLRRYPGRDPREGLDERGVDYNVPRCNDIDGMYQRVADEIGVEQRNYATDARDSQPDRHIFGAAWHEQTHDIAEGQALSECPSCILVGSLCKTAIGQVLTLRKKSGRRFKPVR